MVKGVLECLVIFLSVQVRITCKYLIDTLEHVVKYVQS